MGLLGSSERTASAIAAHAALAPEGAPPSGGAGTARGKRVSAGAVPPLQADVLRGALPLAEHSVPSLVGGAQASGLQRRAGAAGAAGGVRRGLRRRRPRRAVAANGPATAGRSLCAAFQPSRPRRRRAPSCPPQLIRVWYELRVEAAAPGCCASGPRAACSVTVVDDPRALAARAHAPRPPAPAPPPGWAPAEHGAAAYALGRDGAARRVQPEDVACAPAAPPPLAAAGDWSAGAGAALHMALLVAGGGTGGGVGYAGYSKAADRQEAGGAGAGGLGAVGWVGAPPAPAAPAAPYPAIPGAGGAAPAAVAQWYPGAGLGPAAPAPAGPAGPMEVPGPHMLPPPAPPGW
jgi:hypothetical protein